jgi:hypothetical protein
MFIFIKAQIALYPLAGFKGWGIVTGNFPEKKIKQYLNFNL